MTFSIMTFLMTFNIITLNIIDLSITTHSIMAIGRFGNFKIDLNVKLTINDIQHNDTRYRHLVLLCYVSHFDIPVLNTLYHFCLTHKLKNVFAFYGVFMRAYDINKIKQYISLILFATFLSC